MSKRQMPPSAIATPAERLNELVSALYGLTPQWQNPERFHERKSDLIAGLRALAAQNRPRLARR